MRVIDQRGNEVRTGDIVWGKKSYIFLQCDGERVEVKTTDDRRMFVWLYPNQLNLRLEATNEESV